MKRSLSVQGSKSSVGSGGANSAVASPPPAKQLPSLPTTADKDASSPPPLLVKNSKGSGFKRGTGTFPKSPPPKVGAKGPQAAGVSPAKLAAQPSSGERGFGGVVKQAPVKKPIPPEPAPRDSEDAVEDASGGEETTTTSTSTAAAAAAAPISLVRGEVEEMATGAEIEDATEPPSLPEFSFPTTGEGGEEVDAPEEGQGESLFDQVLAGMGETAPRVAAVATAPAPKDSAAKEEEEDEGVADSDDEYDLLDDVIGQLNGKNGSQGSATTTTTTTPAAVTEKRAPPQEEPSMLDAVWSELSSTGAPATAHQEQQVKSTALDDVFNEITRETSPRSAAADEPRRVSAGNSAKPPAPTGLRGSLGAADRRVERSRSVLAGADRPTKERPRSTHIASSPTTTIRPASRSRASSMVNPIIGPSRVRLFQRRPKEGPTSELVFNLAEGNPNSRPTQLKAVGEYLLVAASDMIHVRSRATEGSLGSIGFLNARLIVTDSQNRAWVTGPKDPTIFVFDLKDTTAPPVGSVGGHSGWITGLEPVAGHNNLMITASADMTLRVWDTTTLQTKVMFKGHTDLITSVASWNNYVFSGSCDASIRVWNLLTEGKAAAEYRAVQRNLREVDSERVLYGHEGWVVCLAMEENALWSAGRDLLLIKWNLEKWTKETSLKLSNNAVKLLTHNKYLYVVDEAFVISVFRKGRLVRKLSGHSGKIRCLEFSDRFAFSAGDDRTIRIWKLGSWQCVESIRGHKATINDLLYERQAGRLLSCSDDGTVRAWQIEVPKSGVYGAIASAEPTVQPRLEFKQHLALMEKDPLYRSVVRVQAIRRMAQARGSYLECRELLAGARNRYQALCELVSFQKNQLVLLTNFATGFLVPFTACLQSPAALADAGLSFKADELSGLIALLGKLTSYHTGLLERLEAETEEYPYIFSVGRILAHDKSDVALYMELLGYAPVLAELALKAGGVGGAGGGAAASGSSSGTPANNGSGSSGSGAGADEKSPFVSLIRKAEVDSQVRIDRLGPRSFLWALPRYFENFRLPLTSLVSTSPQNATDVAAALEWWARVNMLGHSLAKKLDDMEQFLACTTLYKSLGGSDEQECAVIASEAGSLLREELAQSKHKLRKEAVKLYLFSRGILLVGYADGSSNSGSSSSSSMSSSSKGAKLEVVRLRDVASVSHKAGEVTLVFKDSGGASPSTTTKKAAAGASHSVSYSLASKEAAASFSAELESCLRLVQHRITDRPLDAQLADGRIARPVDGNVVPDFVIALIQSMEACSAEVVQQSFRLPVTAFKAAGPLVAFNTPEPKERVVNLSHVISTCGYQNLLAALMTYLRELPDNLVSPAALQSFAQASSVKEAQVALAFVAPKMRPTLLAVLYFLHRVASKALTPVSATQWNPENPPGVLASLCSASIFWQHDVLRMSNRATDIWRACTFLIAHIQEIEPSSPTLLNFTQLANSAGVAVDDVMQRKKAIKEKYEAEERERKALIREKERAEVQAVQEKLAREELEAKKRQELEEVAEKTRREYQIRDRLQKIEKEEAETGSFAAFLKQQQAAKAKAEEQRKARQTPSSPALGGAARSTADLSDLDALGGNSPAARRLPQSGTQSPAARASPAISRSSPMVALSSSSGSGISLLPGTPLTRTPTSSAIEGQVGSTTDSFLEAAMAEIDLAKIPNVTIPALGPSLERKPGQLLVRVPEIPSTMERREKEA